MHFAKNHDPENKWSLIMLAQWKKHDQPEKDHSVKPKFPFQVFFGNFMNFREFVFLIIDVDKKFRTDLQTV